MSGHKVLFVDDESNVLSAIKRVVIDEDYTSFFAGSGDEALKIMEKHEMSVIVTDMRMPVMDGLTLLKIVKEKYPRTVRIVLSGYTQLSQMLVTINQGEIFKFITKPWTTDEGLRPVIKQGIDYYNLQVERDTLSDNLAKRNLAYQNIFRKIEQKTEQEKEELHNLYKISGLLFSLLRKSTTTAVDEFGKPIALQDQVIDVMEETYLTYLSQLPTVIDKRTSSELIHNIVQICDHRLAIQNVEDSEFTTVGNHKFLLMMFKILVHNIPQQNEEIRCSLLKHIKSPGELNILFVINLALSELNTKEQARLKLSCTLLNKMGNFYHMGVSLEYLENDLNSIRVIWKIS